MKPTNERNTHWLRPNDGTRVPHNLVFVDTEATRWDADTTGTGEIHTLQFGFATHVRLDGRKVQNEESITFYNAKQFWEWLTRWANPKYSLWIMGHNLAYDLTLLGFWELLDSQYLDLRWADRGQPGNVPDQAGDGFKGFMCLADPPFIVVAKCANQTYRFVDTRNYWPGPLAELGESVGLPKLPMPGDAAETDEWEEYCKRDVQIIRTAVTELILQWREKDLGNFRFSAAGLAWHAYRHKFMERHSILIDECEDAIKLARAALAGGECRCFFIGHVVPEAEVDPYFATSETRKRGAVTAGPVHCLDASSFYASCMEDNYFPRRLVAYRQKGHTDDVQAWRRYLCIVARVKVQTRRHTYPTTHDEERYWAQGRFWTTLAGPELLRAVDAGEICGWGPIAAYERGKLFTKFVQFFWKERLAAWHRRDKSGMAIAKMLLNALPGKFAQQTERWEDSGETVYVPRWGVFPIVTDGVPAKLLRRVVAGYVQLEQVPGETQDSFPAITAYVNSYARVRLAELRAIAGSGNVFYQDTDSLHVSPAGMQNLDLAGELGDGFLGKLRLVTTAERVVYRGVKDYTWDGEHVVAGLKGKSVEEVPGTFKTELWEGPQSIIGRGPDRTVRVTSSRFTCGKVNHRGLLLPSGLVLPATIVDGQLVTDTNKVNPLDRDSPRKRPAKRT